MKTYSNKSNARRAALKTMAESQFVIRPHGDRFYIAPVAAAPDGRGGARVFMTGKGVRRTHYPKATVGETVFEVCNYLMEEFGRVPYRVHVEEACVAKCGVTPGSARAGYTHWKQVNKLAVKAGRPSPEDDAKFEALMAASQ